MLVDMNPTEVKNTDNNIPSRLKQTCPIQRDTIPCNRRWRGRSAPCRASSCTTPGGALASGSFGLEDGSGICSHRPRLVDTPRCEPSGT